MASRQLTAADANSLALESAITRLRIVFSEVAPKASTYAKARSAPTMSAWSRNEGSAAISSTLPEMAGQCLRMDLVGVGREFHEPGGMRAVF